MPRAALALTLAFLLLARAGGAEPEIKSGDVLRVMPGGFPMPGFGLPLAKSPGQAAKVGLAYRKDGPAPQVKFAAENDIPFIRAGSRVKATGPADKYGVVPVEVVGGTGAGKKGYAAASVLARKSPPPASPVDLPEERKKKLYARYFELLTESFRQARKEKPGAGRVEFEELAGTRFGQKLVNEAKAEGIGEKDWFAVVREGISKDWPAGWGEK